MRAGFSALAGRSSARGSARDDLRAGVLLDVRDGMARGAVSGSARLEAVSLITEIEKFGAIMVGRCWRVRRSAIRR